MTRYRKQEEVGRIAVQNVRHGVLSVTAIIAPSYLTLSNEARLSQVSQDVSPMYNS